MTFEETIFLHSDNVKNQCGGAVAYNYLISLPASQTVGMSGSLANGAAVSGGHISTTNETTGDFSTVAPSFNGAMTTVSRNFQIPTSVGSQFSISVSLSADAFPGGYDLDGGASSIAFHQGNMQTFNGTGSPIVDADVSLVWPPSLKTEKTTDISFATLAGHNYQVQGSADGTNWVDYGSIINAASSDTKSRTVSSSKAGFWRVFDATATAEVPAAKNPSVDFGFCTMVNSNYQWQSSSDLLNWHTNGLPFVGSGNSTNLHFPLSSISGSCFYRLSTLQ